jgi:hypothetical protein
MVSSASVIYPGVTPALARFSSAAGEQRDTSNSTK